MPGFKPFVNEAASLTLMMVLFSLKFHPAPKKCCMPFLVCIPKQGGKGWIDTFNKKYRKITEYSVSVLTAAKESSWVSCVCPRRSSNPLSSAEVEHNPSAISSVPKVSAGSLICPYKCNGNFRSASWDLHPLVKSKQAERKREEWMSCSAQVIGTGLSIQIPFRYVL